MARATPSRNLFGFGKRKKTARRKAAPKRGKLAWLTEKKVTYRRDVKGERAELLRQARADRSERARADREARADERERLRAEAIDLKRQEIEERKRKLERKKLDAADRKIEQEWREKGYRNPGCARTLKTNVSDRAKRYRANQKGCRPSGVKKCKLCGSKSDVMVDHADGNESNGRKSNLRWLCRSCNNTLGAAMSRTGQGRRTVQYNPAHKGAQTLGEYMQAVLQHTRGRHDAAGKIIHETPKWKRKEFASEIWARRESHGTARPGSGRTGQDEPDWVTNPQESATEYRLGYNLGQMDRQNAQLSKTQGELYAAFRANFGHSPNLREFESAYATGYNAGMNAAPAARTNPGTAPRRANGGSPKRNAEAGQGEEYEQAKRIAELFHGRPVKEEITVTESIREHDWLWRIGPLVKLKVRTLTKQNATLPFHQDEKGMVHLFCSPDGRQFYLRGGDQELNLEVLGMGESTEWYRDHMLIGEAKEITYRDKKKFHRFKLIDYYHKLGEVTKQKPMLAYDAFAGRMQIIGGQYKVETEDLVDGMSPGIVN